MELESKDYFDLPALLAYKELNIRKIATEAASLSIGDYFGKLADFLSLAPDVSRALGKFENLLGDREARRSLDRMIPLLESMGCEKFVMEFYSILDAYERQGNWRLAATQTKQIRGAFNDFYTQIEGAKRKTPTEDGSLPLKDYIRKFDDEAAAKTVNQSAVDLKIILAVDDSTVILQSVASVLSKDYKVYTLPKPTELANVLQKLTPDLFLLDYQMPELNGFELVPIIRGFEKHKATPVIFLTSEGTIHNVTAAVALGARDFIVKPFNPEILREKIAKHILG